MKELMNYFCASRSFQIILSDTLCVCESELLCKCCCVSVKLTCARAEMSYAIVMILCHVISDCLYK